MAQVIQFEEFEPGSRPECQACEAMLADALDDLLDPADRAWFDAHIAVCEHCSAMLADAQRGAAWLEMLKFVRPEPSSQLLERILAQTSGNALPVRPGVEVFPAVAAPIPAQVPAQPYPAPLLPFRPRPVISPGWLPSFTRSGFEPRLAMTAAMAFFSIALTLNLTGVRLDQLRFADLNPSSLKRNFYEAKGDAARRYDSLRVVHVLESRVDDLKAVGIGMDVQSGAGSDDSSQPRQATPAPSQTTPAPAKEPQSQPQDDRPEPRSRGVSHYAVPEHAPQLLPAGARVEPRKYVKARWWRA